MKKYFLFIMLLAIGMIYSCADNQTSNDTDQLTTAEIEARTIGADFISFNMPFPEGTKFEIEGSAVHFTLPNTHYIAGIDDDGQFYQSLVGGTGSITCECTQGSGCDPITSSKGSGCLMKDGCSKCTKTKATIENVDAEMVEIAIFANKVNTSIRDFSDLNNRFYLPKTFLEFENVKNIFVNIQSEFSGDPNEEVKTAFIDVLGYVVAVDVPARNNNISSAIVGGSGKVSCKCDVEGTCPLESSWGVKWCNSDNCTKCTMSGVKVEVNNEIKEFSINDGIVAFNR